MALRCFIGARMAADLSSRASSAARTGRAGGGRHRAPFFARDRLVAAGVCVDGAVAPAERGVKDDQVSDEQPESPNELSTAGELPERCHVVSMSWAAQPWFLQ